MIYNISETILSESQQSVLGEVSSISPYYAWKIEIDNIKTYYIGGEDNPIKSGSFTVNRSGMGKASLFYEILDEPIISQDKIKIYRNGEIFYQGFVDTIPDLEGGKISISPFSVNFKNTLYNADLSSTFVEYKDILETMISEKDSQTGILYNASDVNTGSTDVLNPGPIYKYETMKKILDEASKQFDDRYMGVDKNNYFYVRKFSTSIDYEIFADDETKYETVDVVDDDKKVKATRYQVYQETTDAGKSVRLGSVGYTTSSTEFPTLSIENRIGIREARFTAPKGLDSTAALNYAYQELVSKAVIPTNIKIKGLDFDRYPLGIGDKIKVQKPEALIWRTIVDCESTSGWTAGALSTDAKVETYSMTIEGDEIEYVFGGYREWRAPQRIGFYVKSDKMGNKINLTVGRDKNYSGYSLGAYSNGPYSISSFLGSTSEYIEQETFNLFVKSVNSWLWVDKPITVTDFNYLKFTSNDTSATIKIDDIKLFQQHKQEYTGNVIQLDFKLGSSFVNVQAGEFFEFADDEFFLLQKNVEKLQQITEA